MLKTNHGDFKEGNFTILIQLKDPEKHPVHIPAFDWISLLQITTVPSVWSESHCLQQEGSSQTLTASGNSELFIYRVSSTGHWEIWTWREAASACSSVPQQKETPKPSPLEGKWNQVRLKPKPLDSKLRDLLKGSSTGAFCLCPSVPVCSCGWDSDQQHILETEGTVTPHPWSLSTHLHLELSQHNSAPVTRAGLSPPRTRSIFTRGLSGPKFRKPPQEIRV